MKKYLPIILILSIVKLTIQLLGNKNYAFQRDELVKGKKVMVGFLIE